MASVRWSRILKIMTVAFSVWLLVTLLTANVRGSAGNNANFV